MAEQGNELMVIEGEKSSTGREYRKGNWTLHETLVLITAKKMDDERRMSRGSEREGRGKPAEQRWKWVEDYCWRNGCMRSQNQCNDRWDNLMRDYKKVRDHERKAVESGGASYWKLERHERKEMNLPSNLLPQIYEALVDVVERRDTQKTALPSSPHVSVSKGVAVHQASIEAPSSSFMPPSHKVDPSLARPPPLLHGPVPTPAQAMPPLGNLCPTLVLCVCLDS